MGLMSQPKKVGIRELRNRLSAYLREVRRGRRVLVTDRGRVFAELRPATPLVDPREATTKSTAEALERLLAEAIWPRVPEEQLGSGPSKAEREVILGYGSRGV